MSGVFDYQTQAKRLAVEPARLEVLEARIRRQYGIDQMMLEPRMLRTLQAVAQGTTKLVAAIAEFAVSSSASASPTA